MAREVSNLEAGAEFTRDRIAATVDDLQHRLSQRALVGNAFESIGAQGTNIMRRYKRLPVAIQSDWPPSA